MAEEKPPRIDASDVTFRELSEDKAVEVFMKDGYTEYQKRSMRYGKFLPANSIWAKTPATMFVAYFEGRPVGVIGYSRYKGLLLDAGVHVRKEYRGRGLGSILLDKIIKEKGKNTLLVNIANSDIINAYRKKGFIDMDKDNIPEELLEELNEVVDPEYPDQVQKYMQHLPERWMRILKFSAAMRPSQIKKPEEVEVEVELDRDALAESCCEQAKLDVHNAWIKAFEDAKSKLKPGQKYAGETDEWWREGIYNHTIENTCYGLKDVIREVLASHRTHRVIRDLKKNIQKILDEWEECEIGN